MWEQKQPGLLEKLAELFGSKEPYKTFVDRKQINNGFLNPPAANASIYTPPTPDPIQSPQSQIIREGINKYMAGDYGGALNYFNRAKTVPGNDPNIDMYIMKVNREMEAIKQRGLM